MRRFGEMEAFTSSVASVVFFNSSYAIRHARGLLGVAHLAVAPPLSSVPPLLAAMDLEFWFATNTLGKNVDEEGGGALRVFRS